MTPIRKCPPLCQNTTTWKLESLIVFQDDAPLFFYIEVLRRTEDTGTTDKELTWKTTFFIGRTSNHFVVRPTVTKHFSCTSALNLRAPLSNPQMHLWAPGSDPQASSKYSGRLHRQKPLFIPNSSWFMKVSDASNKVKCQMHILSIRLYSSETGILHKYQAEGKTRAMSRLAIKSEGLVLHLSRTIYCSRSICALPKLSL